MHTQDHTAGDGIARAIAVVGLVGVALIHLLDLKSKFDETPYMAWMYIGLIIACLGTAYVLIHTPHRLAWAPALALPASAAIGFTLTRTVGLPQATGDKGNWLEPLGLASLMVEGCLVALSADQLLRSLRRAPAASAAGADSRATLATR